MAISKKVLADIKKFYLIEDISNIWMLTMT